MSIGIRKFNMKKLGKLLVPLQPYIEDNISLFLFHFQRYRFLASVQLYHIMPFKILYI